VASQESCDPVREEAAVKYAAIADWASEHERTDADLTDTIHQSALASMNHLIYMHWSRREHCGAPAVGEAT
jgi:hypothetical protein